MSRVLRLILFLSVFLSIYGSMHFYVFARLAFLFSCRRNAVFYIIVAVSALSYLAAHILDDHFGGPISRGLYGAASVWMGITFLLFTVLLVYEVARLMVRIPPRAAGAGICVFVALVGTYAIINAMFISVRTVEIRSTKIRKALTVAHISDVHAGSFTKGLLGRIVDKTLAARPDIVCITGDLVDRVHPDSSLDQLGRLGVPVYYVTGNHDEYAGLPDVMGLLYQVPVTVLRDRVSRLNELCIIGIDDSDDALRVGKVLSGLALPKDLYTILLYHRPEGFQAARNAGVDLMLAGHVHAGQIFPFNLFVRLFYPFTRGLHEYQGMMVHVSPGSGTWGPPMRLGSRNEITMIKLVPERK